MKELIDEKMFVTGLYIAASAIAFAGLVFALVAGRMKKPRGMVAGIALLLGGGALAGMWLAYNALTQHFGLDSVKGLLINLALFAAVGVLLGLIIGWLNRKLSRK
jgi:DMSO/TMAO reductase YedYZ heme-binding membrane subunit